MKLNPDCVRAILLTVEEATDFYNVFSYETDEDGDEENECPELLKPFSDNEIKYHINQCNLSGFFTDFQFFINGSCMIEDLSPLGHEFLANIRKDTVWNKIKDIAVKAGVTSLPILTQIASNVATELIKIQLGINS